MPHVVSSEAVHQSDEAYEVRRALIQHVRTQVGDGQWLTLEQSFINELERKFPSIQNVGVKAIVKTSRMGLNWRAHRFNQGLMQLRTSSLDTDKLEEQRNVHLQESLYIGVYWDVSQRRWKTKVNTPSGRRQLGTFNSELSAARAYDLAVRRIVGPSAPVNYDEQGVLQPLPARVSAILSSQTAAIDVETFRLKWVGSFGSSKQLPDSTLELQDWLWRNFYHIITFSKKPGKQLSLGEFSLLLSASRRGTSPVPLNPTASETSMTEKVHQLLRWNDNTMRAFEFFDKWTQSFGPVPRPTGLKSSASPYGWFLSNDVLFTREVPWSYLALYPRPLEFFRVKELFEQPEVRSRMTWAEFQNEWTALYPKKDPPLPKYVAGTSYNVADVDIDSHGGYVILKAQDFADEFSKAEAGEKALELVKEGPVPLLGFAKMFRRRFGKNIPSGLKDGSTTHWLPGLLKLWGIAHVTTGPQQLVTL